MLPREKFPHWSGAVPTYRRQRYSSRSHVCVRKKNATYPRI